jgi:oligosaccharide repeat unit polymerase
MNRPNANQPPRRNPGVFVRTPSMVVDDCPRPDPIGSTAAVMTIAIGLMTLKGDYPADIAAYGAKWTAAALFISALFDLKRGLSNLIRADVMAMLAFYFLTLFEFLFPQDLFNTMAHPQSATIATQVVLVTFLGMIIGRHFIHPKRQPFQNVMTHEIPAGLLILFFWIAFFMGYLHQWSAPLVAWDPVKWLNFSMAARFEQPWGRGRLGDIHALLYELNMLINLLPPLAGIILARRHRFSGVSLVMVMAAYFLTLFLAYCGGTRNVLATFLVTFVIGFAFASPKDRKKELIGISIAAVALLVFGTLTMIHIRTVGLKRYLAGEVPMSVGKAESLYVDYNLYNISKLSEVFPARRDYLGIEVAYLAIIRPIPRALWKGKPEGLSNSIEKSLGYEGGNVTISASCAGEAYMAGGIIGALICGLFFGAINGWWSHLASPRNSELGILIYSSGFFAAVISMRSVFTYTTALLPTVAAIVGGTYLVKHLMEKSRRSAFRGGNKARQFQRTARPMPPKPPATT